jgi:hypothetical protein
MAPSESRSPFRLPWQSGRAPGPGSETPGQTATVDVPAWPSHDLVRPDPRTETRGTVTTTPLTDAPATDAPETAATTATDSIRDATTDGTASEEITAAETSGGTTAAAETTGEAASEASGGMTATGPTEEAMTESTHEATTESTHEATTDSTHEAMTESTHEAMTESTHEATTGPTHHDPEMAVSDALIFHAHGATEVPADLRGRKPMKFLADLTRAMRQAADEARQGALALFQTDVAHHVEAARADADAAAEEVRRRADDDIAALREWSNAEITRIKQETEDRTAARRAQLEEELAAQTARLEQELQHVQGRIVAFEAEMEAFFQRLLQEDDPSAFAGVAEQLPEPPVLQAWHAMAEPEADDSAEAAHTAGVAGGDVEAPTTGLATTAMEADPSVEWTSTREGATRPMRPDDFAAAEAEAATWQTELAPTEEPTTDTATEAGAAWATVGTNEAVTLETARTQVTLVGLVSVASIATFKRLLSRVPGVRTVQVASGPDGEFLFKTLHRSDVDMAAAVAGIQGFDVHVVESGEGTVSARAVDPEVV